jgi:hypothetical protein
MAAKTNTQHQHIPSPPLYCEKQGGRAAKGAFATSHTKIPNSFQEHGRGMSLKKFRM